MQRRNGVAGAVATLVAVALLPAVAQASTKVVYAGPPPNSGKIAAKLLSRSFGAKYNPEIDAFFRQRVTIHVGDTVSFELNGFHNVDLPSKGGSELPLLVPGKIVTRVKDAAGNPFWFNGQAPFLDLNPPLLVRTFAQTYDGSSRVQSGLPLGPPKPLRVTFTKAGTFKYFCDVHPGMVGYVVVKPKAQAVPSARQDAAALTGQVIAAVKVAKKLVGARIPANTVSLGVAGAGGVELFNMFPASLTVRPGTVVTFTMSRNTREIHTATFGPAASVGALAKGFNGAVFPPAGTYADGPVQPITLSPSSHGNGFANTGLLDGDPRTLPGFSSQIDFTTPGVYRYICLIHPFMRGTIVVK